MQYGVLCLLPPAAMLIFALKTKKSFEALIFGTLIAYLIMYKAAFIGPWCDLLLSEISNADNQYILLLCGLFGGFIFLLREAKGTLGFSNLLSRFCKNERITMMMSVFLGIIIFVDDYLNIMTVGTCMKDVCDKRKVPRQALAYIIDSTGAPVCALIPFSTWVVFYSGVFIQEPGILNMGFSTGMSVYLKVLPYMFYPMAALLVVILFACKLMPKLGKMKDAYTDLEKKEQTPEHPKMHNAPSVDIAMAGMSVDYPPENTNPGNILDFLIPIGILIGVTVATQDMMQAIILALASCMILYLPRKKNDLYAVRGTVLCRLCRYSSGSRHSSCILYDQDCLRRNGTLGIRHQPVCSVYECKNTGSYYFCCHCSSDLCHQLFLGN